MKFCGQCGKTVAILGDKTLKLCPDCAARNAPPSPASDTSLDTDLLNGTLTVKDGKLHFFSKEGWLLWSGNAQQPHTLQQIINQASRILEIRKRKKK